MEPFNLFEPVIPEKPEHARPEGFRRGARQIGPLIGASRIGATVYEVPPGQRTSPYHYEYNNEEWLVVIEGRPILRTPNGERELRPGDVVAFPEGPAGAHAVLNDRTSECACSCCRRSASRPSPCIPAATSFRSGEPMGTRRTS